MFNLFLICSSLEEVSSLKSRTSSFVDDIFHEITEVNLQGYFNGRKELDAHFLENKNSESASIIINTSGGTEDLIEEITKNSNMAVLVLADSKRNSFASSLEAYSFLKDKYPIKLFYDENEYSKILEIKKFIKAVKSIHKINKANFTLFGSPSDWLLTSRDFKGFGNFKTKLTQIEISKLVEEVDKITNDDSLKIVEKWKSTYSEILVNEKSLLDSAKVYLALKNLVAEYKINSLSIRCFDLLDYNYTACMALSMCNDEGITSGCEGDIPTTFTMMIAEDLSGGQVWMANPSSVDKKNNQIVFAHCTIPSRFISDLSKAGLTTHMESEKSTAIRGPLQNSDVTVLRISKDFGKILVTQGRIIDSDMQNQNLCRTQAVIQLNGSVEKWMHESLGNHQVITYGNILDELNYFCSFAKIEMLVV